MESIEEYIADRSRELDRLIDRYDKFTIVTHINPDADTIGTALGIYHILKQRGKSVEVVNSSFNLPRNLNFLSGFEKIKSKSDYKNSLIISCDCGDITRLGIDRGGRYLVNIDHHIGNTEYGDLNIVLPKAVSASEVAFRVFEKIEESIPKDSAEAFYTALISDTRNFTTNNVGEDAFTIALKLIKLGANPAYISKMLILRRSLASIRILSRALHNLELFDEGRVGVIKVYKEDINATGAESSDLDGVVDYAKSLVTVNIAVLIVEYNDHLKVSLRSKDINILPIATKYGGGGHYYACGFTWRDTDINKLSKSLIEDAKIVIREGAK